MKDLIQIVKHVLNSLNLFIARTHDGFRVEWVPISKSPANLLEVLIQLRLKQQPHNFLFVQLGANDGQQSDYLRPIILKYNLSGILVEPLPFLFNRLKESYILANSDLRFENIAISPNVNDTMQEPLNFHYFDSQNEVRKLNLSGHSSLNRQLLEKLKKSYGYPEEIVTIPVPVETVEFFLKSRGIHEIDLLMTDVEGSDIPIVSQFIKCGIKPNVIVSEVLNSSSIEIKRFITLLEENGYRIGGNVTDLIAYRV